MDEKAVIEIASAGLITVCIVIGFWILASWLRKYISSARGTHIQDLGFAGEDPSSIDCVGLDKEVIEALPVIEYKSDERDQCAVCLSEFGDTERVNQLPNCNHYFHKECIDIWFRLHTSCPVCRTVVQPNLSSSLLDLEKCNGREGSLTKQPISSVTSSDAADGASNMDQGTSGAAEDEDVASNMDQGSSGATPLPHVAIHVPNGSP